MKHLIIGDIIPITLLTLALIPRIAAIIEKLIPKNAVNALLFGGGINEGHKTKYALAAITDRYKESIKGFNTAVSFNIGFVTIALYGYIVLPSTEKVTIPIIGLSVSRLAWVSIVPLISYALQIFIFTSFIWLMVLRQGMDILYEQVGPNPDYGDVKDILLDGSLGQMWIILRIMQYFNSKWHLIWAIPVTILILTIITSPILICIYFIIQLFGFGSALLAVIYSIFLIPFTILFLLLIATTFILGIEEYEKILNPTKNTRTVTQVVTVKIDDKDVLVTPTSLDFEKMIENKKENK